MAGNVLPGGGGGTKVIKGPSTVDAAKYGGTPGQEGANIARDEAWKQTENNNAAQGATWGAARDANDSMYGSGTRGPQAQENAGLANNEAGARYGHQNGAIGLAGSMARGNTPSQGAYQLQRGLDQGMAQQASMAGSARGGASLATAQSNQGYNNAAMQQNAFSAAGQLRASDMAQGRGLYGSLTTQQRQQDQERLGQANQMQQGNAARNDKFGLGMGNLANQFGELGNAQDQTDFGYDQMGMAPINDQFQAEQQRQEWLAGNRKTVANQNIQEEEDA
ncbi:hypothetical protein [Acidithiobacillus sp.]|uniref:hypothetical protein n=1 Tax=Acidithiobacillus sp. TaxID=1872118 RepID=UPI00258FAB84|nr:hypothetical protein [Acidithiobacillus sp.]MDD5374474.1 hypothetical protein [Acidithiobacillus sp.]